MREAVRSFCGSRVLCVAGVALLGFINLSAVVKAQSAPRFVKDVWTGENPTNPPSSSINFRTIGSLTYFAANQSGVDTWVTDGTAAGTHILFDMPDQLTANDPGYYVSFGGSIYFRSITEDEDFELWRTDGTAAGTELVVDIDGNTNADVKDLTVAGTNLYFTAKVGFYRSLWVTDGTAAGTQQLLTVNTGPEMLTPLGNKLIFRAAGGFGEEVFVSDGTPGGTAMLSDISSGFTSSFPDDFVTVGSQVFFTAQNGTYGREVWVTDGTAASVVKDIYAGALGSDPGDLVEYNGKCYFRAMTGSAGHELFVTDGTALGTSIAVDIRAGAASSYPAGMTVWNGNLYFSATNGTDGIELWRSDGTALGTSQVKNIHTSGDSSPDGFAAAATKLFFTAETPFQGRELWVTDGTGAGTTQVINFDGSSGGFFTGSGYPVNGDQMIFTRSTASTNFEPWVSDGTAAGTGLLLDIGRDPLDGVDGANGAAGDKMIVGTTTPTYGAEPWVSDGTDLGTGPVNTSVSLGGALNGATLGSKYIFSSDGNTSPGAEPWQTDGTAAGTSLLLDISPGLAHSSPGYFNTIGSYTYFRATSPAYGHELWRTDGSTAGTVRLTDINPGALDSVAGPLALRTVELGGDVFFSATDGSGTELWRLNPSTLGLVQVGQIAPGPEDPQASIVGVAGTKLFLSATTAATGSELWVSDGDSTPTLVVDLKPGSASSYAGSGSVVVGSLLYFWALNASDQYELHVTDGTGPGTIALGAVYGALNSPIAYYGEGVALGNELLFELRRSDTGSELWKSDGTPGGTGIVKDIFPGLAGSEPALLQNLGGTVYFTAFTPEYGRELWTSDGTALGTGLFADVLAGSQGSAPDILKQAGAQYFFSAWSPTTGRELYSIALEEVPPVASAPTDAGVYTSSTSVTFNWTAPTDAESGVSSTRLQIGTTPGGTTVFNQVVTGTSRSVTGTHGQTLYARLIVVDLAGNQTTTASSDGITIDTQAPIATASVASASQVEGQVAVSLSTSDGTGSPMASVALYARRDSGTWALAGDISSGSLLYTPPTSGLYYLQAVGTDSAGRSETAPSGSSGTGETSVVYNATQNSAVTIHATSGSVLTFPMTNTESVTLDFGSATIFGNVTVQRFVPVTAPPGIDPGGLLNESLSITGAFTGTATIIWSFDPANAVGLAGPIDTLWRFNGSSNTGTFAVSPSGNTITISTTGFSNWYAGLESATVSQWKQYQQ